MLANFPEADILRVKLAVIPQNRIDTLAEGRVAMTTPASIPVEMMGAKAHGAGRGTCFREGRGELKGPPHPPSRLGPHWPVAK